MPKTPKTIIGTDAYLEHLLTEEKRNDLLAFFESDPGKKKRVQKELRRIRKMIHRVKRMAGIEIESGKQSVETPEGGMI